jgi:hypothetical protein
MRAHPGQRPARRELVRILVNVPRPLVNGPLVHDTLAQFYARTAAARGLV